MQRSLSGGHHIGVGGFNRNRLRSNASDASSTDDLDSSFNSGVSPAGVSTTIFNYSTLKEQLNSPAKRSQATTKWCQNSAAVTAQENNMAAAKLRSSSASNIVSLDPPTASTSKSPNRARKAALSRSRSIEVIVDNTIIKRKSNDNETIDRISLDSRRGRFAKSCDRLDYDHNPMTSSSSFFLNDDDFCDNSRTVNILNVTLNKRTGADTISVVRLDENVKAKIEKRRSVFFVGTPPTTDSPVSSSKCSSSHEEKTNFNQKNYRGDTILNRASTHGGNTTSFNRSISEDNTSLSRANTFDSGHFLRTNSYGGNSIFTRSNSEDITTNFNNCIDSNRMNGNELNSGSSVTSTLHLDNPREYQRNSMNLNNFSINEEDETNDSLATTSSSNSLNISHENSLSASLSNEANMSGLSSETSTVFGDNDSSSTANDGAQRSIHESSILEDIAEREDTDDVMPTSASLDSAAGNVVLGSSVTISFDDSYLDENDEERRRDTLDSQGTIGSDGKSGMFSMDRSITTDSINSIATSDASHQSPDDGDSSVSSSSQTHGVVHSHSDETIAKRSGDLVDAIALPPKSSSLSEKKSGISPYFRRKKSKEKEAAKKEKHERKLRARSMADALSDEPVLISIKETGDGRMIFDDSESSVKLDRVLDGMTKKGVVETASIPIPVPAHVAKKSSPSATPVSSTTESIPKRKRSLYFRDVFKKVSVRRANSEQSLLDIIPPSTTAHSPGGMKSAFSSVDITNGSNTAMSNGHVLPLKSSPRNTNTSNNNNPDFDLGTQSLERSNKKNTSLRERLSLFTQLSSSEVDIHKASSGSLGMDGKNSLKKDKKKLKSGSLRILNAAPKESTSLTNGLDKPIRKTSMIQPNRPQYVTRKSISINRGPLKIMSIFKHWLAKHPKVNLFVISLLTESNFELRIERFKSLWVKINIVTSNS